MRFYVRNRDVLVIFRVWPTQLSCCVRQLHFRSFEPGKLQLQPRIAGTLHYHKVYNSFAERDVLQKPCLLSRSHLVRFGQMSPTNSPLVELALDAHCDLGESPIWDTRKQMLYFVVRSAALLPSNSSSLPSPPRPCILLPAKSIPSPFPSIPQDINRKSIHAFSPSEGTHEALELSEPIGCIALTSDPACLLAATQRDILLVRFWGEDKGPIKTLATVPEEHGVKDMRFNDGKVTPQGAFLVGRMHSSWRKGERGRLYALDPGANDLREVLAPSEVWLPNGLVWTEDGKVCYFVDSGEESITAYETDALVRLTYSILIPINCGKNGAGLFQQFCCTSHLVCKRSTCAN